MHVQPKTSSPAPLRSTSKSPFLATLIGPDYLQDAVRGGYRLAISDAITNAFGSFFTDTPAAMKLPLGERAGLALESLAQLKARQPEIFQAKPGDEAHVRSEKAKLSEVLSMLAEVKATGVLPERGWGLNPARTMVAHLLIAADR